MHLRGRKNAADIPRVWGPEGSWPTGGSWVYARKNLNVNPHRVQRESEFIGVAVRQRVGYPTIRAAPLSRICFLY